MNNFDKETEIRTGRIKEIRQRYLFLENKDPLEENLRVEHFVKQDGYQEELGTLCSLLSEQHLDFNSEYHIPCWKHWKNNRVDFSVFPCVRNVIDEMINRHWFLFDILSQFCHDDFMLERCPTFTYLADLFTPFKPLRKVKDVPNDAVAAANIKENTLVAEVKAEGIPSPSYSWFKRKNKEDPPKPINYPFRHLYFSPFTFQDVGYYHCEITHNLEVGSDEIENLNWEPEVQLIKSAEILVKPPDEYIKVCLNFENRNYYHGETAKLECIITTFGQAEIQWFKGSSESNQWKPIHGQTKPTLNLVDLRTEDACDYYARVYKQTSTGTKREETRPVKLKIINGICDKIKSTVSGCCVTVEETKFSKQKINIGEEICLIFDVQCNHNNIPTEDNEVEYYYEPRFLWMKTGYKYQNKNKTTITKAPIVKGKIVSTSKRLVDLIELADGVTEWRYQCFATCDMEGRTVTSKVFKVEVGNKAEKALPEFKIAMIVCQTFENDDDYLSLPGAKYDGKELEKKLKSLEFSVFLYKNLSSESLRIAVENFVSLIDERTYAVFYHNGHGEGIQGGDVSLLGVDNGINRRGYHGKEIIAKITEKKPSLGLVLFDCCRVGDGELYDPPHYEIDYDIPIVEGYSVRPNQRSYALGHGTGVFIRYVIKHIGSKHDLDKMTDNIQQDFRNTANEIDRKAITPNFNAYILPPTKDFTCLANPLLSKKVSRLQKKFFDLTDTYHGFRPVTKGSENRPDVPVLCFKEDNIMIEIGCKVSKFHNKSTWKLMVRLKRNTDDTWTSTQTGNISVAIGIKNRKLLVSKAESKSNMKYIPSDKTEYTMSIYINNKKAKNGDFILTLCNNEIKKELDTGMTEKDGPTQEQTENVERPILIQSKSRDPVSNAMEENLRQIQELLVIREQQVAQREYFLAQREQNLTYVANRESNITIREDNIATREYNIAMREAEVATREATLAQREIKET